ncbi:MAG: hypothetical protein JW720_02635 [Sedimentisphaerales bacterium]|nr:hypothetical protein [Sedimentisphaerales bacterium]
MRYSLFLFVIAALILPSAGCKPCCSGKETQVDPTAVKDSAKGQAPLLLDDEPLLLDDAPENEIDIQHGADNSRCFVCHINYMQEKIAVVHARKNMSCAHCHGESDAHIADESWASGGNGTAPEKIYTKDKVNSFCTGCHAGPELPEKEHKALFANPPSDKHCTDCHGNHLLTDRKTKWK